MYAATIALAFCGVAITAMIGAVFEVRRLRRAGAPRKSIKRAQVATLVFSLAGLVALVVGTSALPESSGPNSESVAEQLFVQLAVQVSFAAFTIWFIWWRIRKVRRMSEDRGEPILTRRAEAAVDVDPALALQWTALAIRNVGAHSVEVDPEVGHITARTPLHWDQVSYCVTADIHSAEQGGSVVHLTAWPSYSEMATSDLGAVQYFVDQLAKDIVHIGEDPPERETPATVMRQVLTEVAGMPEAEASIRAQAKAAIEVLDAGRLREAEDLTNQVLDALRFTYGPGDPVRRVGQINLGRKIAELGGITDAQPIEIEP